MKQKRTSAAPCERSRKNQLWIQFVGGIFLCFFLAGCVFLYYHKPGECSFLPPCFFYKITHLYCPGCGSTRALYSLLHGDWWMAFRCNPLILPLLVTVVLFEWKPALTANCWVVNTLLWVILLYWLVRNLPFYPFTLFVPPVL